MLYTIHIGPNVVYMGPLKLKKKAEDQGSAEDI